MNSTDRLAATLDRFLDRWRVEEVLLVTGKRCGNRGVRPLVDAPRLRFVVDGAADVQITADGQVDDYSLGEQRPLFTSAGVVVRPKWTGPAIMACVVLGAKQTRIAAVERSVSPNGEETDRIWHRTAPALGTSGQLTVKALDELSDDAAISSAAAHLSRALLGIVRSEVFAEPESVGGRARRTFLAIQDYVCEHCCEPISRAGIAKLFDVTPTHLSRLFRQQSGQSFSQVLTHLRLEQARILLSSSRLTVGEVAYQCGYNDPSYFIRVFREHHAVSPGRFSARGRKGGEGCKDEGVTT